MTDRGPQARPSARRIAIPAARTVATVGAWLALYYLLPLDREATWASVSTLVVGLALLVGLVKRRAGRIACRRLRCLLWWMWSG